MCVRGCGWGVRPPSQDESVTALCAVFTLGQVCLVNLPSSRVSVNLSSGHNTRGPQKGEHLKRKKVDVIIMSPVWIMFISKPSIKIF
jgi:hypothetical protein